MDYDDEPSFSLHDFKKWMSKQHDQPNKNRKLIGVRVESKIHNLKNLIKKIEIIDEEYDVTKMAKEFSKYGGMIIDADEDSNLTIEVDSGNFMIPKFFVKKVKPCEA